MTTRAKVICACQGHGVLLLDDGDCIRADAPPGFVLKATGLHAYDCYKPDDVRTPKAKMWAAVYDDVKDGIEKCPTLDCETCKEGMTFDALEDLYGGERLAA